MASLGLASPLNRLPGETSGPPVGPPTANIALSYPVGSLRTVAGTNVGAISLAQVGSNLVLQGLGPNIRLHVTGNVATGQGTTVNGKAGYAIRLTTQNERIRLDARHDDGSLFTTYLRRN